MLSTIVMLTVGTTCATLVSLDAGRPETKSNQRVDKNIKRGHDMRHLASRSHRSSAMRLAAILTTVGLATIGCSSVGSSSDDDSVITLGAPTSLTGENAYQTLADKYMDENPDITVELTELPNDGFAQALNTQLQAGNAPDVFYVTPGSGNAWGLIPLAKAGYLEALTGSSVESTIPDTELSQFTVDGKIYGQALDLTVVATTANNTALEADGFTLPDTFDGVLDLCKQAAAKDKSLYVVAGSMPPNTGLMAMSLAASRVYAADADWNTKRAEGTTTFADTAGWKDTLQAVLDMNSAGCFQDGVAGADYSVITSQLGQGASYVAFTPGASAAGLEVEVPGSTFTVNAMPGPTADATTFFASANNALALNAKSTKLDAAKAFLEWMAQPAQTAAYAKASGNLPVGETSGSTLPEEYAPVAEQFAASDFTALPNAGWANAEVYTALGTGIQGLLTGQATVDQVLKSMDDAWDA